MIISLDWLNSYLAQPVTGDALGALLTAQGFPIEGREMRGEDEIFDVEVTSNRGDCLSHLGIAREVAAGTGCDLVEPDCELPDESKPGVTDATGVDNEATDVCPVYTARVIRGVKVGPSPKWLVDRLEAIGLRSVNNIVDVTNFVMMELGEPMHAFDCDKLAEDRIVVRKARKGETITAIDGTKHELDPSMCMICDAERPVAVAGVMGGLDSEVGEQTTNVLLEAAIFDPLSTRRTSRALKLSSDSSYRFERGIDPRAVDRASRRAAKLFVELAGGEIAEGVIRAGADEPTPTQLGMRIERCNRLLGIELSADDIVRHLDQLGLAPTLDDDTVQCAIPTYRLDLEREVDLVEEVARLHGLDNIGKEEKITLEVRSVQPTVAARQRLAEVLVAHGYHETITFSFLSPDAGKAFLRPGEEGVFVDDDRRKAEPMLRPSLLPSLLVCRKANQDAGNVDVRLFETASTYSQVEGAYRERHSLALLADAEDRQQGLRAMVGTLTELAEHLCGRGRLTIEPIDAEGHNAAANVLLDGEPIGTFGLLDAKRQKQFDLQTPVVAAELDAPSLLGEYPPMAEAKETPRQPTIERDLSVIVEEATPWRAIEQAILDTKPAEMESLEFVGTYRGKPIAKGNKSVTLRMVFRAEDRTLRHDEVDPQMAAALDALKKNLNAELRT